MWGSSAGAPAMICMQLRLISKGVQGKEVKQRPALDVCSTCCSPTKNLGRLPCLFPDAATVWPSRRSSVPESLCIPNAVRFQRVAVVGCRHTPEAVQVEDMATPQLLVGPGGAHLLTADDAHPITPLQVLTAGIRQAVKTSCDLSSHNDIQRHLENIARKLQETASLDTIGLLATPKRQPSTGGTATTLAQGHNSNTVGSLQCKNSPATIHAACTSWLPSPAPHLSEAQEVCDAVAEVAECRVEIAHQMEGHPIVGEHLGVSEQVDRPCSAA